MRTQENKIVEGVDSRLDYVEPYTEAAKTAARETRIALQQSPDRAISSVAQLEGSLDRLTGEARRVWQNQLRPRSDQEYQVERSARGLLAACKVVTAHSALAHELESVSAWDDLRTNREGFLAGVQNLKRALDRFEEAAFVKPRS